MALFGKKDPCPICGGKVKGLFTWKIEGQAVCDDCHGYVDLPQGATDTMTLGQFREYMAFRDQNNQLKQGFQTTHRVDFGFLDDTIAFDIPNRMVCMDKKLKGTVFEGKDITSFVIKEDMSPLIEGSSAGLYRYQSSIPERANAMAPMLNQMRMQRQLEERLDRMDDDDSHHYRSYVDITEPFKNFNVEIYLNHPFWPCIKIDMCGPTFSNSYPDVNSYLRDYERGVETMEDFAKAVMSIAFPNAPQQAAQPMYGAAAASAAAVVSAAPVTVAAAPAEVKTDPVEEILRYKTLLDQGIITQEEFDAKKRQLMGL